MIKRMFKSLFMILMVVVISNVTSMPVYASDSVSTSGTYSRPTNPNEQWRFITVVKDAKWTPLKTVEGQPTKGTYLKKGDMLFYGESGGKSVGLSFGVALGPNFANASVSVSFDIPLGKTYKTYYGKAIKANASGYYLIKAKKYIKPTIVFIQYRHKKTGYLQSGWGNWEKPKAYTAGNKYEVVKVFSDIYKQ